jgi:fibronectin-binding autotransporter adhesin
MRRFGALATATIISFLSIQAGAQSTFNHATGSHFWNVADNWTPPGYPDAPAAAAILPGPDMTGVDLTIDLGEDITLGSLEIQKPVSPNAGNTNIVGSNTIGFFGGPNTITNKASAAGTGATTIAVPIQPDPTLTINQESDSLLQFDGSIMGGLGITINRTGAGGGMRTVALNAANTYGGNTTLVGGGSNDALVVRLGHADAIPATSTIAATDSVVFELAAANFARTIGTGSGQFTFTGRSGWGAIGADRTVTLNGGASVNFTAITNQLILGTNNSTHTVDFTNPLVLNGGTRIVRSFNGSGAIDGKFSGVVSGSGALHKQEGGMLSLANDNTYTGLTRLEGGALRLDHPGALGDGNLEIGSGGTLGIGADTAPGDPNSDFARDLGSGAGQVQFISLGGGNNQANGGFAAFNGDRTVTLNSGAELVWGSQFFLGGAAGTHSRNLLLGDVTSDSTTTFTNPIDLGAGNANPGLDPILLPVTRNVVVRDGSAEIDAVLPGVLRGTSSLTKDNTGTLVLGGNNTYSGGTVIVGGRLLVNNVPAAAGDSGTGTGAVTLSGTSTLGGTGSIAGVVTVNTGTHVAPGTQAALIESLEVGGLTLETGSILDFELGTPNGTPGVDNDLITVLGTTTLNGIGTVNLTDAGGLGIGNYTLIDYTGELAGSDIVGFLSQTPTGPAGFIYALVDTGSTIDLAVLAAANDADFNDDGIADAADYVIWRKFNGAMGTGTANTGDANGDSNVDELDYNEWRENFGSLIVPPPPGGGNGGAVPEPATLALMCMAAIMPLERRGRWNRK